jgi:hypothetical protein
MVSPRKLEIIDDRVVLLSPASGDSNIISEISKN